MKRTFLQHCAGLLLALLATPSALADRPPYPATPVHPVTDTYHGVTVSDPYRWLEDDDAPDVRAWVKAQNALTREWLDRAPGRADIEARVAELLKAKVTRRYDFQFRGGRLFAMRLQPPANQPVLVVLPANADPARERVVLDPNALDPSGHTTIDFFSASFDGRRIAVSLSKNGSEDGDLHFFDVASGRALADTLPHIAYPTAGGSVEWAHDNRGVFYTRFPAPGERPEADAHFFQTVWFHALGTPQSADRLEIGREFPRIAEVQLRASRDGRYLLAAVRNGDGGEVGYHLRDPRGAWKAVAGFKDDVKEVVFGSGRMLYARTVRDAPLGKIVATPLASPDIARARVVVPESTLAAEDIAVSRTRIFVQYRDGGPSIVRTFNRDGRALGTLPTPPATDTNFGPVLDGDNLLLSIRGYTVPTTWYRFVATRNALVATALSGRPTYTFDDAEVVRAFATSRDGTQIPLSILRRKGTPLDGTQPVLLYAYGGYGISMTPYYSPLNRLWLDWGGVFVVAHIRGGGEYGEPWHQAGMLTKKQNVFDDFAASMQWLVDAKYTTPARLAIMGGSNGGLTMGAALTQHPEAMRAVVSSVGIYDSLRVETTPNGEFNVTEFGTVRDEAQFRALYAYSPLVHVKDGTAYPAVLMTSGDNDGRVPPYESRKMIARLQAATSSDRPILLRTDAESGHGIGSSLSGIVLEEADVYTFLFTELGMRRVVGAGR
ncbi:MAG: S9 family peptidase [Proteobacteria bacterium]|nr:S9 family peptidase [Pseudomonadota bacterium]